MKKLLLLLCCAISYFTGLAQVNYVLNPSFEAHSQCPTGLDQLRFSNYWSSIDTAHVSSLCSAEYCNKCGVSLWGVPGTGLYYQYPRTGDAMIQSIMFYDESHITEQVKRDYTTGHLSISLIPGKSYCVSFYVVLVNEAPYAIDHIGAYLDDGSIANISADSDACALIQTQFTPQVYSASIISDTLNWTKIEGSFIATGAEKYITIGNFADKASTNFIAVMDTTGISVIGGWTNYLVDDVSVIESDLQAFAGNDTAINQGDSVFIGRNEIILGIRWSVANSTIDTVHAGFWVKPQDTTTYVLQQNLCGNITFDTVTVFVIPPVDTTGPIDTTDTTTHEVVVSYITYKKGFTIYPNPSKGQFNIHSSALYNKAAELRIYDLSGRQLRAELVFFDKKDITVQVSLMPGIYIVELIDSSGGRYIQRLIIK